jgi:beta-xylosidase
VEKKSAMRKIVLLLLLLTCYSYSYSQNPFIRHIYTADPSARVLNDTLWVYPSHDEDTATWFSMVDWHVFSTTDMKKWTDHGVIFSVDDISWADRYAWAPDCIGKNDKYYFYYPVEQKDIGVAVADRPNGPFKDPLGKPLISKNTPGVVSNRDFIDPAVFIDDDGQAYLFMGQNDVNVIKLNEDMISYDGKVYIVEGAKDFFEAVWVHKYKDKYYLSYSGDGKILYGMSNNVLGPYEYKGVILEEMSSGTNHHSIVEFKGKCYLFYHNSELYFRNHPEEEPKFGWTKGVHPFRRSICVDEMYYNEDGTIQQVIPTVEGVDIIR